MVVGDIARIGRLLADDTRVALLDALFDNRAYTVTELAQHTRTATSTTSEHLAKLLDGGLVTIEAQGRHRYYRLSRPEVAGLLESVFEFTAHQSVRRVGRVSPDLAFARTCYDHLAGTVAVALADHLVRIGAIIEHDAVPHLTDAGRDLFAVFQIDDTTARSATRPQVRYCLDWTERRHHLAGAVPAALLAHMIEQHWCAPRHGRALRITETGRRNLRNHLGFDVTTLG